MDSTLLDDRYIPFKSSCSGCKHFNVIDLTFEAFPNGIPTKVLTGETVHNKVITGQYGKIIREEKGETVKPPPFNHLN